MIDDITYAVRLMARQKTFTAAALVTLALGIGANTAIFSMVYGVLLRPLPYPTADRLVRLAEAHPGGTPIVGYPVLSNVTFHEWRKSARTIEGVAAYTGAAFTARDRDSVYRVQGSSIAPALFDMLGARPLLGRLLQEQDNGPPATVPRVVVLSAGLWQERFGGDPSAVGKVIVLDGEPYTIVGVAARDFYFPNRATRLWVPLWIADTPAAERISIFAALALLRPGSTAEQGAAEGTAAARAAGPRHLSANLLFGTGGPPTITARPLLDEITSRVRPALLVLLGSVALVLLIACANVSNLLLSRGIARGRELAVRAAIGAGHGRLARQLMVETLVLSLAGGALGVALGWALTRMIPVLAPEDFPRVADIQLDGVALVFAALASLGAGLIAGVLPALRVARGELLSVLREGAGASTGVQTRRLGAGLLVAEAAVAVMLLVAAGLLARSFVRLLAVDPGYARDNVLMARVHLEPRPGATDREELFAQALVDRVRAMPGVLAAGVGSMAPLVPNTAVAQVTLRGDSAEPITARTLSYVVTPGYGEALSLRVLEGRLFDARDMTAGIRPVIINEAFARAHFRDGRPIVGRRFNASFSKGGVEIVGVVANVLKDGLDAMPRAEMYNLPRDAFGFPPGINLVVRTSGDPLAIIQSVQQAVRELDRWAALDEVQTLGSRVSASVSEPRFAMSVLMAFAAVALVLAAVGLYGVLSYQVLQRRREMGVRAALGATRGSIVRLVVREGLTVTVAGVALGIIGAAALSRVLQGLLFGVTPHDAIVFTAAPVALLAVAVVATLIPARRAASTNPIEALRCE